MATKTPVLSKEARNHIEGYLKDYPHMENMLNSNQEQARLDNNFANTFGKGKIYAGYEQSVSERVINLKRVRAVIQQSLEDSDDTTKTIIQKMYFTDRYSQQEISELVHLSVRSVQVRRDKFVKVVASYLGYW